MKLVRKVRIILFPKMFGFGFGLLPTGATLKRPIRMPISEIKATKVVDIQNEAAVVTMSESDGSYRVHSIANSIFCSMSSKHPGTGTDAVCLEQWVVLASI